MDACWPHKQAPVLGPGSMVRVIPGVIFDGRNTKEEQIAMVMAVGCVYRADSKVVQIVSHVTGRHYELPADAWFEKVEALGEVFQLNFADEVEVLPNTSFTSDLGDLIESGAKGRICERPEVGPAEEVICVAWYQSGRATQVRSPFMRVKPSKGQKLSNAVEVRVYGAPDGQDAGSADAATPCTSGELGRARVLEDLVEVTCYSGTRSAFPRRKWPEGFEIVGEALELEPGLEVEQLPGPGQATNKSAGQSCIKGRIASVAEDSDNVFVVLYDGSLRATSKADWFASFKKVGERHNLVAGDELEALPRGDDASGCPGAERHGHKGRVSTLEQGLRMAWYDGPKDETPYSAEDWLKCFRLTGKARTLARYEAVRAVGAATGWPEPGEPGRIISIEDGKIFVAWDYGAVTTVAAAEWVNELQYVSEAVTLDLTCELMMMPPPLRHRGEAARLRGRIVELRGGGNSMTVMWYDGSSTENSTADWPKYFIFTDEARMLRKGYELKLLPNRDGIQGVDGDLAAGSRGRVTDVVSGRFTLVTYDEGMFFVGSEARWLRDFELTSIEVPLFEEGMELSVLPGNHLFDGSGARVYMPGYRGRVTSWNPDKMWCCFRWYQSFQEHCMRFEESSWMKSFLYLNKATGLEHGVELELLPGERCPPAAEPGGEVPVEALEARRTRAPQAQTVKPSIKSDITFSRRFLSAFEGPPTNDDENVGLDRKEEEEWCSHVPQVTTKDVGNPVDLKYREMLHRGRVTKINAETFCVTWYTGPTSCETVETQTSWVKRFQLTDQAVKLEAPAVVEVLRNDAAALWGGVAFVGRWALVSEANASSNRLCLRWTADGPEGEAQCNQTLDRWESSLRYVGRTQSEAQVLRVAKGQVIRAINVSDSIGTGDEGAISWADSTHFCTTWFGSRRCSCHSITELEMLHFIIIEVRRDVHSCCAEGVEWDVGSDGWTRSASRAAEEVHGEACGWPREEAFPLWELIAAGSALALLCGALLWRRRQLQRRRLLQQEAEFELELADLKHLEVWVPFISDRAVAKDSSERPSDGDASFVGSTLTGFDTSVREVAVSAKSKFSGDMVPCLRSGEAGAAATGLTEFLGIPADRMAAFHNDPSEALEAEWRGMLAAEAAREAAEARTEARGQAARMLELVEYILHKPAEELEERSNDGYSMVIRDLGNKGLTLIDFHSKEQSIQAQLSLAQVAALRIYTSELFKYINPPFRNPLNRNGFQEPHPVGITVLLISEGLKKLRKLNAGDNTKICFWRGMKDLVLPTEFEAQGGTELQCMSTTENVDIAAAYGQSDCPLVFCVQSDSFMTRGADISWLSLYPHEKEILYPPLTYLQFVGKRKIKNSEGYVAYVRPIMN